MPKPPLSDPRRRVVQILRVSAGRINANAPDVADALARGDCINAVHIDSIMREDVGRVFGALEVLTPGHPAEQYTRFARSDRTHPRRFNLTHVMVTARDEGRGMAAIDTANRSHDRVQRACVSRRPR